MCNPQSKDRWSKNDSAKRFTVHRSFGKRILKDECDLRLMVRKELASDQWCRRSFVERELRKSFLRFYEPTICTWSQINSQRRVSKEINSVEITLHKGSCGKEIAELGPFEKIQNANPQSAIDKFEGQRPGNNPQEINVLEKMWNDKIVETWRLWKTVCGNIKSWIPGCGRALRVF